MDPAGGKFISRPVAEFKKLGGVVLLLIPSENFKRGNERTPVLYRFWQLIQPHRSTILQAILVPWSIPYWACDFGLCTENS
jgi:ATP-binding cassette subfamily B protein